MNAEGDIVFDSLPYIDGLLDLNEAQNLITKELNMMKRENIPMEEASELELFKVRKLLVAQYIIG